MICRDTGSQQIEENEFLLGLRAKEEDFHSLKQNITFNQLRSQAMRAMPDVYYHSIKKNGILKQTFYSGFV